MNTLEELFKEYNYASDKLSRHSYIPVYEQLFRSREYKVFNLLEIGIGSGGSLLLWHDYFQNAEICGIDPTYVCEYLAQYARIHQIKDDAYTKSCIWNNFVAKNIKFDIIIDDGPHNKWSQMMTMQMYFPLLTHDGIIVIEDVPEYLEPGVWIKDIIGALPEQYQEFARVIDLRHHNKSPDDVMIVLDRSKIDD